MAKSRGIYVKRGTRQRWLAENEGKHFCHCGCGKPIPLKAEHFNVGVPNYLLGHNQKVRPSRRRKVPLVSLPCACGCGAVTTPGRRFISGHNGRGTPKSAETRRKIGKANTGQNNGQFGKVGAASATWRGGRLVHGDGYIQVHTPDHPFAVKRYVMEHRLVYENYLRDHEPLSALLTVVDGRRYLCPDVEIHHRDEDKSNNVLSNLQPMTKAEHARLHSRMARERRARLA